jgi:hypothetical protein
MYIKRRVKTDRLERQRRQGLTGMTRKDQPSARDPTIVTLHLYPMSAAVHYTATFVDDATGSVVELEPRTEAKCVASQFEPSLRPLVIFNTVVTTPTGAGDN